jgi:hypothetical protein
MIGLYSLLMILIIIIIISLLSVPSAESQVLLMDNSNTITHHVAILIMSTKIAMQVLYNPKGAFSANDAE